MISLLCIQELSAKEGEADRQERGKGGSRWTCSPRNDGTWRVVHALRVVNAIAVIAGMLWTRLLDMITPKMPRSSDRPRLSVNPATSQLTIADSDRHASIHSPLGNLSSALVGDAVEADKLNDLSIIICGKGACLIYLNTGPPARIVATGVPWKHPTVYGYSSVAS